MQSSPGYGNIDLRFKPRCPGFFEDHAVKLDTDIKNDVDTELKWNPEIDATDIATKVVSGAVMLSGFVKDFYEKHQAEITTKRVAGVTAVANDLVVRPAMQRRQSDPELARQAVNALKLNLPTSWKNLKIAAHGGQIDLEGTVEWQFLRDQAEAAIRRLRGVRGVRNSICVEPTIEPADIKSRIEAAFLRNALLDSGHVKVEVRGPEVILRGEVRSWAERDQACQGAWSAPGVRNVIDAIKVRT
jgi:osmotically-inducible protein OsmY